MTDNATDKTGEPKAEDAQEPKPGAVEQLTDVGDVPDPDEDDLDDLDGTFAPFCMLDTPVLLTLSQICSKTSPP
jgi:hypothetical protein